MIVLMIRPLLKSPLVTGKDFHQTPGLDTPQYGQTFSSVLISLLQFGQRIDFLKESVITKSRFLVSGVRNEEIIIKTICHKGLVTLLGRKMGNKPVFFVNTLSHRRLDKLQKFCTIFRIG